MPQQVNIDLFEPFVICITLSYSLVKCRSVSVFPLIIGELLNTLMAECTGCSLILVSMSRDDITVLLSYLNSCFPEGMIKFILHLVSYSSLHLQELVGIKQCCFSLLVSH